MSVVIACIIGYLLGSIPNGYIVGRLMAGVDVRTVGSGKTGATNVRRLVGWKGFFLVLFMDVAKGALAVLLARWLLPEPNYWAQAAAGVFAVVGHTWPLFLGFRGGRGTGHRDGRPPGDGPTGGAGAGCAGYTPGDHLQVHQPGVGDRQRPRPHSGAAAGDLPARTMGVLCLYPGGCPAGHRHAQGQHPEAPPGHGEKDLMPQHRRHERSTQLDLPGLRVEALTYLDPGLR